MFYLVSAMSGTVYGPYCGPCVDEHLALNDHIDLDVEDSEARVCSCCGRQAGTAAG